jgi:hypothetical protein
MVIRSMPATSNAVLASALTRLRIDRAEAVLEDAHSFGV